MHELSIAQAIHKMGRAAVAGKGSGHLESVRVAVGELTAVEPDLLVHAWEATTRDGPDDGARLLVDWHPARQFCLSCGEAKGRGVGRWLPCCPDCGMPMRTDGGGELDLLEVTFVGDEEGERS
jgi:hydrogenase nickel incorporation protein HypA/HybF